MSISPHIVGEFIDSKAGTARQPLDVAGRLMEEVVELCLAAGLNSGQILVHVTDALYNQSLKASKGKTVFPSQLVAGGSTQELHEEIADVGLVLKDLAYVSHCDQDIAESHKWSQFIKKDFRVSSRGTLYAVKPHIK